ncbi:hypothetical protein KY289_037295 [Solanum tuberosum]|nr:hypothetical protein KY289_037295 [Solanum tuberosum]
MIICERVASLELSMMEVVAFIRDEKLRRAQKHKKNEATVDKDEDYTAPTVDNDGAEVDVDELPPLVIVDEDQLTVDEYFAEEVNEQEEEKMAEKDEEREEEQIEENKEEEKKEEQIELQEEEKEQKKMEEKVDEGSDEIQWTLWVS